MHIGPSFDQNKPDANSIDAFRSKIHDDGACFLFDLWVSGFNDGIAKKSTLDPTLFPKLLPQIIIEELDEIHQESKLRLVGEFYKDIYEMTPSEDETSPYSNWSAEEDVVDLWQKSDQAVYKSLSPSVQYFDLSGIDKHFHRLGELNMPVRARDGKIQSIGYSWKIDKDNFQQILNS